MTAARECDKARFWSKVDKSAGPDACWPWKAGRNQQEYGVFWLRGRNWPASRAALVVVGIDVPDDENIEAIHSCDNPPCCNPKHLHLGTVKENAHDAMAKGRRPAIGTHCGNGHEVKDRTRKCPECRKERGRRWYRRHRDRQVLRMRQWRKDRKARTTFTAVPQWGEVR